MNAYPHWICAPCGEKRGKVMRASCTTWHDPDPKDPTDVCGWCDSTARALTEPRDYGYPPAPKVYPKVVDLRGKGYA